MNPKRSGSVMGSTCLPPVTLRRFHSVTLHPFSIYLVLLNEAVRLVISGFFTEREEVMNLYFLHSQVFPIETWGIDGPEYFVPRITSAMMRVGS